VHMECHAEKMDVRIPADICMKRLTSYSFRSKLKKETKYGLYR
jgi:hypothetical protein